MKTLFLMVGALSLVAIAGCRGPKSGIPEGAKVAVLEFRIPETANITRYSASYNDLGMIVAQQLAGELRSRHRDAEAIPSGAPVHLVSPDRFLVPLAACCGMRYGVPGNRFKPASAAWELWGWSAWALPTCAGRGLQGGRAMDGENGKGYVWFENCHVFSKDMRLLVAWDGRIVPLPVAILHPDCRLAASGDVGRLGVPRRWAEQRELIPRATT